MLPPGRARLVTYSLPTGSFANENMIGMVDVACLTAGTAAPPVTMTLTFNATNSAAISAKRSLRPSGQRITIATLRPCPADFTQSLSKSGKPGKLSRRRAHPEKADSRELARLLRTCPAAVIAQPSSAMNSRRPMKAVI